MKAGFLIKLPPSGAGQLVQIWFSPPADGALLLIARERNLFCKHRVRFGIGCETSRATIRRRLLDGQLDQTESLASKDELKLVKALSACWASGTLIFYLKLPLRPIQSAKIKK